MTATTKQAKPAALSLHAPSSPTISCFNHLAKVAYGDVAASVSATIVDQTTIENIRTAPASERTYRSEHQRGTVVLGTARTFSGQTFTVQRLMVGQLDRGFLHQLGFHALGRLLSFVSGDDVLMFGYPMECPRKSSGGGAGAGGAVGGDRTSTAAAAASSSLLLPNNHNMNGFLGVNTTGSAAAGGNPPPAMLGLWLPVEGLNVRLIDLQRMRVMFAEEGILCATNPEELRHMLAEVERRRQQHSILSPNTQQRVASEAVWSNRNNYNNYNNQNNNNNNINNNSITSASSLTSYFVGLPESPVSLEPARSPPGGSEAITVQLPVILYRPPRPHLVAAMDQSAPRGFRPFVDTTHRKTTVPTQMQTPTTMNTNNNNNNINHHHHHQMNYNCYNNHTSSQYQYQNQQQMMYHQQYQQASSMRSNNYNPNYAPRWQQQQYSNQFPQSDNNNNNNNNNSYQAYHQQGRYRSQQQQQYQNNNANVGQGESFQYQTIGAIGTPLMH